MLIPQHIILFKNKNGLVFAIGQKHAIFYSASGQDIEEVDRCVVMRPKYSDREGHSEVRGSGGMGRVGGSSMGDRMQRISRLDFEKELKAHVHDVTTKNPHDVIYILAPKSLQKKVIAMIPVASQKIVHGMVDGNFVESNPVELLEIVVKKNGQLPILA